MRRQRSACVAALLAPLVAARAVLDLSQVVFSNLGGAGPDHHAPHAIRYHNVTQAGGRSVDLVISTASSYLPSANVSENGHACNNPQLGSVNLQQGTQVDLLFKFLESGNEDSGLVKVDSFELSILLQDSGEVVELAGFSSYCLSTGSLLQHQIHQHPPCIFLGSGTRPQGKHPAVPCPGNLDQVGQNQLELAASFHFHNVAEFPIRVRALAADHQPSTTPGSRALSFRFAGRAVIEGSCTPVSREVSRAAASEAAAETLVAAATAAATAQRAHVAAKQAAARLPTTTEPAAAPPPSTGPFDCGPPGLKGAAAVVATSSWPIDRREWCCLHHLVGCPVGTVEAMEAGAPYDCTGRQEAWPLTRQAWCCREKAVGCPETPAGPPTSTSPSSILESLAGGAGPAAVGPGGEADLPPNFDCHAAMAGSEEPWPLALQEWCCKNQGLGCTSCDLACTVKGYSASCRDRIYWRVQSGPGPGGSGKCVSAHAAVLADCSRCGSCSLNDVCPGSAPGAAAAPSLTLPAVGAGPASAVPTPLASATYDCHSGSLQEWPVVQRHWCCRMMDVGCPVSSAHSPSNAPTFNCQVGLANWPHTWSVMKAAWCCRTHCLGCSGTEPIDKTVQADSSAPSTQPSTIETTTPTTTPTTTSTHGSAYDCSEAGMQNWHIEQATWCCVHHDVGCPGGAENGAAAPTDASKWNATSSTSKSSTTPATTATSTDTTEMDCMDSEAQLWSRAKRRWCCEHTGIGCWQVGTPSLPHDCFAKDEDFWPTKKRAWCCTHEKRACDFDCQEGLSNWRSSWPAEKKAWCCQNKHVGCTVDPFDCQDGRTGWVHTWPDIKKDWCCQHIGIACPPTPPPEVVEEWAAELAAPIEARVPLPRLLAAGSFLSMLVVAGGALAVRAVSSIPRRLRMVLAEDGMLLYAAVRGSCMEADEEEAEIGVAAGSLLCP